MDRNVNLNLNILTSSANKDDLREGFNASGPHVPPRECLRSTQTVRRGPCKPEAIAFTSYRGGERSRGERLSDTSAPGGGPPVCCKLSSETPADGATGTSASGAAPRKERASRLFCCGAAGVLLRHSPIVEACDDRT